jgi:hypothetical protein
MPKKTSNRNLSGTELTAVTAEKVFGWKNVHKHDGDLIGKEAGQARETANSKRAGLLQTTLFTPLLLTSA